MKFDLRNKLKPRNLLPNLFKALICWSPVVIWFVLYKETVIYELKASDGFVSQLNLLPIAMLMTVCLDIVFYCHVYKHYRIKRYIYGFVVICLIPLSFDEKRHADIEVYPDLLSYLTAIADTSQNILNGMGGANNEFAYRKVTKQMQASYGDDKDPVQVYIENEKNIDQFTYQGQNASLTHLLGLAMKAINFKELVRYNGEQPDTISRELEQALKQSLDPKIFTSLNFEMDMGLNFFLTNFKYYGIMTNKLANRQYEFGQRLPEYAVGKSDNINLNYFVKKHAPAIPVWINMVKQYRIINADVQDYLAGDYTEERSRARLDAQMAKDEEE